MHFVFYMGRDPTGRRGGAHLPRGIPPLLESGCRLSPSRTSGVRPEPRYRTTREIGRLDLWRPRPGPLPAHPLQPARLLTWCRRGPGAPCGRHTAGALLTWHPWHSALWRARASPGKREEVKQSNFRAPASLPSRPKLPPPPPGRLAPAASPPVAPGHRGAAGEQSRPRPADPEKPSVPQSREPAPDRSPNQCLPS